MIPEIIHQIWLDGEISDVVAPWVDGVKNLGMDYHLWTDKNVWSEVGANRKEFAQHWNIEETNPIALSDVLRVLLVYKHGGFYLDCDIEVIRPFSDLCRHSFVTNVITQTIGRHALRKRTAAYNEFFGAQAEHGALRGILGRMESVRHNNDHFTKRVGCFMFSSAVINEAKKRDDVALVNGDFMKHHYIHSWVDNG